MKDKAFFDTNILVYAFDDSEHRKYDIASQLVKGAIHQGYGVLSTQVLQEFFVTVTRKIPLPLNIDSAEQAVRDFALWTVVETSVSLVLQGIGVQRHHGLSFWDAMVVAAAKRAGCALLYTEDLGHDTVIDGVRIVNPFAE